MSSSSRLPKSMQRTNRRTVLGSGLCASKMFKDGFYSSNHCRSPSSGEAPCCEHHGSSRKHRVPTYRVFNLSNRFTRVVPSPRHNQIWRHPRAGDTVKCHVSVHGGMKKLSKARDVKPPGVSRLGDEMSRHPALPSKASFLVLRGAWSQQVAQGAGFDAEHARPNAWFAAICVEAAHTCHQNVGHQSTLWRIVEEPCPGLSFPVSGRRLGRTSA